MVAVAELAGRAGRRRPRDAAAELRPDRRPDRGRRAASASGSRSSACRSTGHPLRAESIACTGEPHCNFAVAETKSRLDDLVEQLEARFGDALAGLKLNLDGCPHACAITGSATSASRARRCANEQGVRRQAYDILLRGGLGPDAAIARPVFRRVPAEELADRRHRARSTAGWSSGARRDERFRAFCDRLSDDELGVLAGHEPARAGERRSAA